MEIIILIVIILIPVVWTVATYNTLVRLRNYCRESWSGIDTELKRRYNLIPNIVEAIVLPNNPIHLGSVKNLPSVGFLIRGFNA